jgi:hypothetical protein
MVKKNKTNLLGECVRILPHKEIEEVYFDLPGTIVGYHIEYKKRSPNGVVTRTTDLHEHWTVEFEPGPWSTRHAKNWGTRMDYSLTLPREAFKIRKG